MDFVIAYGASAYGASAYAMRFAITPKWQVS